MIICHETCSMTEHSACELKKDWLYHIKWKLSILYVWIKNYWFSLWFEWRIFKNCKNNKNSRIIFLLQCFKSLNFSECLRILSDINYEFYYYYFFYLISFEEQKILCMNRRIEKCYEYFEIDLNNCFNIKTFKLFF